MYIETTIFFGKITKLIKERNRIWFPLKSENVSVKKIISLSCLYIFSSITSFQEEKNTLRSNFDTFFSHFVCVFLVL